jgi:hypothetical protein
VAAWATTGIIAAPSARIILRLEIILSFPLQLGFATRRCQ